MENLAYYLKYYLPSAFRFMEIVAHKLVRLTYKKQIDKALLFSHIEGHIDGRFAEVRQLTEGDTKNLHDLFSAMPEEHFKYFRPHSFDYEALKYVLSSAAILTYGIFVDNKLNAYCLLKVSPTGSAFIGLLVHPSLSGYGLGKFIVNYLYWQASLAQLRTRSTMSRDNIASLKSHQAVSEFKIVADLPNNHIMIEFPNKSIARPELRLP